MQPATYPEEAKQDAIKRTLKQWEIENENRKPEESEHDERRDGMGIYTHNLGSMS